MPMDPDFWDTLYILDVKQGNSKQMIWGSEEWKGLLSLDYSCPVLPVMTIALIAAGFSSLTLPPSAILEKKCYITIDSFFLSSTKFIGGGGGWNVLS